MPSRLQYIHKKNSYSPFICPFYQFSPLICLLYRSIIYSLNHPFTRTFNQYIIYPSSKQANKQTNTSSLQFINFTSSHHHIIASSHHLNISIHPSTVSLSTAVWGVCGVSHRRTHVLCSDGGRTRGALRPQQR